MCGIAGVFGGESAMDGELLRRMLDSLGHRGPDDSGVSFREDHGLGLAAVRLKVIDLSEAGHQPMWTEDRSVGLVYNGEVYNFKLLRSELESHGHRFRSATDTEVILRGYLQWGDEILARIKGMFALGIVDLRTETRLLLARDRLGEKPLYYHWDKAHHELTFASEIKALLVRPDIAASVSPEGLDAYLTLGYIPAPFTIYDGIYKLQPAHCLRVIATQYARPQPSRYWSPPATPDRTSTPRALREEVRQLVESSIRERLISDVPVGAFLSGGVDSTIVVGVMSKLMKQPARTFSAAFDVGERSFKYNVDADAADLVADRFQTSHQRLTISIPTQTAALLQDVAFHADEPHGNPTLVSTYLLAQQVREKGITVVLTGDGSDEIFGGYRRYQLDRYVDWVAGAPSWMMSTMARGVGLLHRGESLRNAVTKANLSPRSAARYLSWWSIFSADERLDFVNRDWHPQPDRLSQVIDSALAGGSGFDTNQDAMAFADVELWLAEESNMRTDKMTMAHSVESRAPFQDHLLVERALSIPMRTKVGWPRFTNKRLLRDAFADVLPPEVSRRPKWGWMSPVHYWVNDFLWKDISLLIRELPQTGLFTDSVTGLLNSHPTQVPLKLWNLAVFSLWHQVFIQGRSVDSVSLN